MFDGSPLQQLYDRQMMQALDQHDLPEVAFFK